jgi:hypothetical protein
MGLKIKIYNASVLISFLIAFALFVYSETSSIRKVSMCFDLEGNLRFMGYTSDVKYFRKTISLDVKLTCEKSSMTAEDWKQLKNARNRSLLLK